MACSAGWDSLGGTKKRLQPWRYLHRVHNPQLVFQGHLSSRCKQWHSRWGGATMRPACEPGTIVSRQGAIWHAKKRTTAAAAGEYNHE
jgi:hypothetical protein